jgi:hypothetical protein
MLPFLTVHGQENLSVTRYDYWMLTPDDEGNWIPMTHPEDVRLAGFFFPCEQGADVSFCHEGPLDIWIEDQFLKQKQYAPCLVLAAGDLCTDGQDTVFIVVTTALSGFKNLEVQSASPSENLSASFLSHRINPDRNFQVIGYLFCFTFLLIHRVFNPFKTWKIKLRVDFDDYQFFTWDYILPLLCYLSLISFSWHQVHAHESLSELLFFFTGSLIIVSGKLIWTFITAHLFQKPAQAHWQMVVFCRVLGVYALLVFLTTFLDSLYFSGDLFTIAAFKIGLFLSLLVVALVNIFIIRSKSANHTLHLFIYFCNTEILPLAFLAQGLYS